MVSFDPVDQQSPNAVAALGRYLAELGTRFPDGFDPGTPPPLDVFVLARLDGATVGCGGLRSLADGVDEVKRMWVDPTRRGLGLGGRLLEHLEELAAARGADVVRLDTHGSLTEAIAMYERHGYARVERYNDNPYAQLFFEKALTRG